MCIESIRIRFVETVFLWFKIDVDVQNNNIIDNFKEVKDINVKNNKFIFLKKNINIIIKMTKDFLL